jgi:glycosyltransferase involved in cell wall biosynthesis
MVPLSDGVGRRLRVVISAYACQPQAGSEPGTGWEWTMAAAARHEVWLLTSARHAEWVRPALAESRPEGLREVWFLEEEVEPIRESRHLQLRYRRWQRAAQPFLVRQHRELGFDLAHHVTWAVDWQPAAVAGIPGLPYVWGPVGGASRPSPGLARWLGVQGLATEVTREVVTRSFRRLFGDRMAAGAALMLAQNDEVAARFAGRARPEVAPHPAIRLPDGVERRTSSGPGPRRALFVGRLEAWKGARVALAALARTSDWVLDVYGDGPDRAGTERLADRLGLTERVAFHGRRSRSEVLNELAGADALLFPSLHDSSGWAVAEAVTLGVPVVALDRGGPPALIRAPAAGITVPADRHAPAALAAALADLPATAPVEWWRAERLPDEIDRYYRQAMAAGR